MLADAQAVVDVYDPHVKIEQVPSNMQAYLLASQSERFMILLFWLCLILPLLRWVLSRYVIWKKNHVLLISNMRLIRRNRWAAVIFNGQ